MNVARGIALFTFSLLTWGLLATSCTVVTDPTKPSTDVTSSTSPGSSSKSANKAGAFTSANFARLKEDMALGRGEHLASLAVLLDIPEERRVEFFMLTKEKFPTLITSEQTTPEELLAALDREIMTHPHLRSNVTQN